MEKSNSFTSQPHDLDQQETPNQQGRESDKPNDDLAHGEGHNNDGWHSFPSVGRDGRETPVGRRRPCLPGLGEVSVSGRSKPPSLSIRLSLRALLSSQTGGRSTLERLTPAGGPATALRRNN